MRKIFLRNALKKRIEGNFAKSVVGRVEVWTTPYRDSHDSEGEAWVTIDKQRVSSMGTYTYLNEFHRESTRLRHQSDGFDFRDSVQTKKYNCVNHAADQLAKAKGYFPLWDFNSALFESLQLSIDEAISSDNPIIRAFATLNRKFGKRRLQAFNDTYEHPLVQTLYRFRCEIDKIKKEPPESISNSFQNAP